MVGHRPTANTYCVAMQSGAMPNSLKGKIVPILIPVSENVSDTSENAVMGIGEYTSLCTNPILRDLVAAICWTCCTLKRSRWILMEDEARSKHATELGMHILDFFYDR